MPALGVGAKKPRTAFLGWNFNTVKIPKKSLFSDFFERGRKARFPQNRAEERAFCGIKKSRYILRSLFRRVRLRTAVKNREQKTRRPPFYGGEAGLKRYDLAKNPPAERASLCERVVLSSGEQTERRSK